MKLEENRESLRPEAASPAKAKAEQKMAESPKFDSADEKLSAPPQAQPPQTSAVAEDLRDCRKEAIASGLTDCEGSEATGVGEPQPEPHEALSPSVIREQESIESTPAIAPKSASKASGFFREQPPYLVKVDPVILRRRTRREFLRFGAGAVAALATAGYLLPRATLERLGVSETKPRPKKEWLLD